MEHVVLLTSLYAFSFCCQDLIVLCQNHLLQACPLQFMTPGHQILRNSIYYQYQQQRQHSKRMYSSNSTFSNFKHALNKSSKELPPWFF